MNLNIPCQNLPGVGIKLAEKLEKCGLSTIHDLLFHLPYRYQDKTRVTSILDLIPNEYSVVVGKIRRVQIKQGRRASLVCQLADQTGVIQLRFFHFYPKQLQTLQKEPIIRAFGEIKIFGNVLEMVHPEYQIITDEETIIMDPALTPIYAKTAGLSQSKIQDIINSALNIQAQSQLEWMSDELLQTYNLLPLNEALKIMHAPPPDISVDHLMHGNHPATKRLIMEELIVHQLSMLKLKKQQIQLRAPKLKLAKQQLQNFLHMLPFKLTSAQMRVLSEIEYDLTQNVPMQRLLQGDVGSGKTIIATIAALYAVYNGYQVALMAPTELLSEQHALTIIPLFAQINLSIVRLTGSLSAKEKKSVYELIQNNNPCLVIGTHALFQEKVLFHKLGLIIIDEQHRFGVAQRLALQQKASDYSPHQLLMTATPIPRTLAMSHLAHLDISTIDELPPGRIPVITTVTAESKRDQVIERIRHAISKKRQVYWVCTLIEESENLQNAAATETATNLQTLLPEAKIGLVHGRMRSLEKDIIMNEFKQGDIDILVATTVIEVGVNVPNASLMIIENAERLGLSQLHQLRGRVGRGNQQSHCLLMYQSPLSHESVERLRIIKATNNGFEIAEKDLQLRGYGEILGTKQTGLQLYKIAQMPRDAVLLDTVKPVAEQLLNENPEQAQIIIANWFKCPQLEFML